MPRAARTARRRDAVDSLFGGERSGKRVQRVYTPPEVWSALDLLWPEGVVLDPCSGPDSVGRTLMRVMPPANGCKYIDRVPALGPDGEHVVDAESGKLVYVPAPPGLAYWPERTYANPEFDPLGPWIRQFLESWEVVLLSPVRPHRKWWRPLLRRPQLVAWLDPLRFVGHAGSFPAPLVLVYRGARIGAFCSAVETLELGEVIV